MNRLVPATALLFLAASASFIGRARAGEPIVPGTGEFLKDCCDDFEDPKWSYKLNLPKSSHEQDEQQRSPGGVSNNGLWHEGGKRGTPDVVKRVATPPGGTPPSKSRFEMILSVKEHEMHHRGQLMLIERIIGIVPHLTRDMKARMAAAAAKK